MDVAAVNQALVNAAVIRPWRTTDVAVATQPLDRVVVISAFEIMDVAAAGQALVNAAVIRTGWTMDVAVTGQVQDHVVAI